ncbi:MAG: TrkH family potassium uptake protein [Sulfurospirillaceae bacterium]|nr:TrkH family potassium uptake protein [Sulfurospirillaceae bacterium]
MSLKSILKFTSTVGLVIFLFFLLPILVGLYYGEDMSLYAISILSLLFFNVVVLALLRKHNLSLGVKESIISVNLVWILLGIGGAIPLVLYTNIDFASAFFEAISGFTTTGASIYTDVEILPRSILFHRSLMHWIGGVGIIVLGVGLLPLINPSGSLSLFKAESTGISIDKITPKIKDTAKLIWGIYLLFTVLNIFALKICEMSWFDAINHALSTVATGGFSTKNSSLGFFSDGAIAVTTFFMIISGINFIAHIRFIGGDKKCYFNEEMYWYLGLFLVLSVCLTLIHFAKSDDTLYYSALHSSFTIATLATTTGFASVDYEQWGQFAITVMVLAMIMSAQAGSTAGGVKIIRYVLFFKNISLEIKRSLRPDLIISLFVDGRQIKSSIINSIFGFFSLFLLTLVVATFYMYARGYDALTSITTSIAMLGNVGPAFGMTGPTDNYAFFSWYDKIFLSAVMIIGRLECYTVFILLSRTFWRKF